MQKVTLEINEQPFQVVYVNREKFIKLFKIANVSKSKTLFNHYEKPSSIKIEIFNFWRNWLSGCNNVGYMGVCSANSQLFSLSAFWFGNCKKINPTPTDAQGIIYITKSYNRLYIPIL